MDSKDAKGIDSAHDRAMMLGYNQTYIILERDREDNHEGHEVLFRCGNWCYRGLVQFNGLRINTEEVPVIVPALQKQQGSLRYYCTAKSIPVDSVFNKPAQYMEEAMEFIASEIVSDSVDKELRKMANVFPWIDDDRAPTYFEMTLSAVPEYMERVALIASKTYTRGLIIISIYYDRTIYFLLQDGEGDQPLLDVRFPDVSKHGQGLLINSYGENDLGYKKLTLWHIVDPEPFAVKKELPKLKTINVSTSNYEQTYCILKSSWDSRSNQLSVHHDALFRFGSWCYAGRVQLTATIGLHDVPFVIPALRMQQSRLDYYCDVNNVPTTSPFAAALEYMHSLSPQIEQHVLRSEDTLRSLIDRLSNMGLGESVSKWLEGDATNSFFEFKLSLDSEQMSKLNNIEIIVSKCYHASGIVTITIYFQQTIYVCLLEATGENPLLDSRFPDISGKGRGYQLEAFSDGTPGWPELRKVSIWQTIGALEQEFREKAAALADSKRAEEERELARQLTEDDLKEDEDVVQRGGGAKEAQSKAAAGDDKHAPETEIHSGSTTAVVVVAEEKAVAKQTHPHPADPHPDPALLSISSSSGVDMAADAKKDILSPSSSSSGEKGSGTAQPLTFSSFATGQSPAPVRVALPHHLPKLEHGLQSKLEDIRSTMGDSGLRAPWDIKGRPLGSAGLGPLSGKK